MDRFLGVGCRGTTLTCHSVPDGPRRKTLADPIPLLRRAMMAPPPQQPEFVEVRCAGCGETLEVERGLTEFACPDCGTQQALPPELMPPPRPRRALPLPGRAPAAAVPVPPPPARMPCAGCSALLSVPAGLGRFACPVCGVELVVDGGRLRTYHASPPAATVSVVALPPTDVSLTYTRQPPEVRIYTVFTSVTD